MELESRALEELSQPASPLLLFVAFVAHDGVAADTDSGSQLVTEQSWIKRENERDSERADTIPDEETRRRKKRSR